MSNNTGWFRKCIAAAVLVVFCSTSLAGCASFRKKFIRQNKNKDTKEDFIPVLEPVEYPRVGMSPMDAYRNHYAMIKAYFSDVYTELDSRSGEKRERYLLGQIMVHIQGMADLLSDAKKTAAQAVVSRLQEAVRELDKPAGVRRYDLLKSAVHKTETDIRRTLKPDMVREFITAQ